MTVEDLYIDNIDEFVKDENKIVTYKWLSQTLQVHCNTAKQMLYKYIDTERNTKETDGLCVTYFVSGLTKPDHSGEQMFKCTVVPEEKLESCKSMLAILTSCHVYSVQKSKLKDSNALYMTDYAKFKENVFDCNKYSSIHYDRATLRSEDELSLLSVNYTEPEKKPNTASNGSTASKPAGKKQPQSAIASMFAKSDAGKKDSKADVKPLVKEEPKTSTKDKGGNKGGNKGGMTAFFSKQTDKKVQEKSPEKKKSPVKTETKSKKTARQEDSDEEVVRSKRRRTQDLFDSGSEEEMEEEPESPIPPTPPPTPAVAEPEIKAESPDVEEIEETVSEKTSKNEESSKGAQSGKRRVRRRKQVNKTYMDKDGFMVTEKVYEEESTDASEAEEPAPKETKKTGPTKSPPKGKKSPKKASPGKKGQGSGKQTSLMSFFKKS